MDSSGDGMMNDDGFGYDG